MAVRTELVDDPEADPEPIHLGYRAGSEWFAAYFRDVEVLGVDHVLASAGGEDPERNVTRFAEAVIEEV